MNCYNCINIAIIYIPDKVDEYNEPIAWCEECSICGIDNCKEIVTNRVYWTVGCHQQHTLCSDRCDKHSHVIQDCSCSTTARDIKLEKYIKL